MQRQTLIRITGRGVSRTKLHTGKRVYDYKAMYAGDDGGGWSDEFRVLEEEVMNNVVRIMNDELLDGPIRLSVWLTKAVEGVFSALRRMEDVLQKNRMVPDVSTYLHTMLTLTQSRWKPAYERARSEQATTQLGGARGDDDMDRVRAYVERLGTVMKANHAQITKRANDARKLQIDQAHRSLDRRQGEIRRFDVVRLLQVARDDPVDVYGPRPGRTVGGVYRERTKGVLGADPARTDPFRLRDNWSYEVFVVTDIVYLASHAKPYERRHEPSDDDGTLVDAESIPLHQRERLRLAGVLPRYLVVPVHLTASAGQHVDLAAIRADIEAKHGADRTPQHARYSLGPKHGRRYHRHELLRIPQDVLHRFVSSVHTPPRTQQTLPAPTRARTRSTVS